VAISGFFAGEGGDAAAEIVVHAESGAVSKLI
jgi:hypothetical protein